MPVPQGWDDIFTNPAQNSPQGSEPIGTLADDYIRQAFAFCKQLHDGWLAANGSVPWTGNQNAGGWRLTGLGAPVDAGDAATRGYADNLIASNFPRGTIVMWWGDINARPAGWLVCDGSNGTPDLRDRVPYGAVSALAYGGNNFPVIQTSQMPAHAHAVNDPGHAHAIFDPGHVHGTTGLVTNQPGNALHGGGQANADTAVISGTYPAQTAIGIYGSGTGIWLSNTGSNAAFDNRPAYCQLWFIMKA